ncbi:hypothetical protein [Micromonospora tarensis]|uniref:HNH endonuclease n=1 Tax=Micromonospora tarensis TaxID=2806100 RepID=A0ABS1YCG5_9ACTN|nr:hypothetical protein [Micromonospora tarensis]MBM0275107.1 hypothetical protein [Micromonospora tarensis]
MPTKGSTTARGYGHPHQQLRDQWAKTIEAERTTHCHATHCLEPTRTIRHGDDWDLGHTDDRTAYTGPEHPRCNRAAGGRKGAELVNGQRTPLRHSRVWFPTEAGGTSL